MEQKMCPVDVISVCSAAGEIRPLRLRMENETHQLLRINIEEVVSAQGVQRVGAEAHVFLCRASLWDRKLVFELKYYIRTHTWWMMRRVE